MDGGGRLSRPLDAHKGAAAIRAIPRGAGTLGLLALLAGAGIAGMAYGGQFDRLRLAYGAPRDVIARAFGFSVDEIAVSGAKELTREEVVAAAGVPDTASLLFLDVAEVRARLRQVPLIADASVRKLHPDRLAIQVTEREPFALWQLEGHVDVVSADGVAIETMGDERFLRLPHVVGPGANLRVKEFAGLLDQVPEFRAQIRAGVLVSERRWTLALVNGVQVKLPESAPAEALKRLVALDKAAQVLSKDILAVDLRVPGRVAFRLSEEAAAARFEMVEKKLKERKNRA